MFLPDGKEELRKNLWMHSENYTHTTQQYLLPPLNLSYAHIIKGVVCRISKMQLVRSSLRAVRVLCFQGCD